MEDPTAQRPLSATRYHALDALRGFAMMLGIFLHSCLAYMRWPLPTWPVRDAHQNLTTDLLVYAIHSFRMQLFFVLAGFFGCLVYQRYGRAVFVRHRLKRIGIPLVVAALLIQPQMQALSLYQETVEQRAVQLHPELKPTFREYLFPFDRESRLPPETVVARHFSSGNFLRALTPMHLWFLYYLLICYALMLGLIAAAGDLNRRASPWWTSLRLRLIGGVRAVLAAPAVVLVLTLLTLPLLYQMKTWQVDSSSSWAPVFRIVIYYFCFFGLGWFLYREPELVVTLSRPWKRYLLLAALALPVAGLLTAHGLPLELTQAPGKLPSYFPWLKAGAIFAQAAFTWLMIWGCFGAFQQWLDHSSAVVRYLADASYWCYLMSMTPIVLLQMALAPFDLGWLTKLLLVTGGSLVLLLITYEWGVRYTFIGAVLHGRKTRPSVRSNVVVPSLVVEVAKSREVREQVPPTP